MAYKSEIIRPEIQKANFIDRNSLLKKRSNHQDAINSLVLIFHPALHILFEILKSAHWCVHKLPLLEVVLPKLSSVVYHIPKTLRN